METRGEGTEPEDRDAGAFVAGFAWVAMVALAIVHVVHFGTVMPALDDLHMVDVVGTNALFSWDHFWAQHNEHRIPLPKLIYVFLVNGTRDFRAGTWFAVALLAALSLALIRAARRLRGWVAASDALFPCLLLHWGHAENLLNSFNLCFVLPVALAALALVLIASSANELSPRRALAIAVLVLLLPACGTVGVVQAPILAAWLAFAAARGRRSSAIGARRAAWIAIGGIALTAIFCVLYFVDFHLQAHFEPPTAARAAITALQFLAASFGWIAFGLWPWSGLFVVAATLASIVLLGAVLLRRPVERQRAAGLLACFAASLALAASVGWGRAIDGELAGLSGRYALLSSPLWLCAYFTWLLYADGTRARVVLGSILRGTLAVVAALIAVSNLSGGARYGWVRFQAARLLTWDVEAGLHLRTIAARHWRSFFYGERIFFDALRRMEQADMGPFWRSAEAIAAEPRPVQRYPMMRTRPTSATSDRPVIARQVDGESVLIVHAPGEVTFSASREASAVRGRFGVYPAAVKRGETDGMLFQVEWRGDDATNTVLAEWRLDPLKVPEDQGFHDFEIELPGNLLGEVVLRTTDLPGQIDARDWGFWTDVELLSGPR